MAAPALLPRLIGLLQGCGELLPFLQPGGMGGLCLIEFLRLALAVGGADEILQSCFPVRDGSFETGDFFFQFPNAILHLLALDGIQAFPSRRFGGCGRGVASVRGLDCWGRFWVSRVR